MNTVKKGDSFEESFRDYLNSQIERGELVYGAFPPELCKVTWKFKRFCPQRNGDVTFDIAIELFANGRSEPLFYIIFECKNHSRPIQERDVTDFSDKLNRLFPHNAKGVLVVSGKIQSGADRIARSRGLGITKYDILGTEIISDRKGRPFIEDSYVNAQFSQAEYTLKPLVFSAFYDGKYYSALDVFIDALRAIHLDEKSNTPEKEDTHPHYLSEQNINDAAVNALNLIDYKTGPVNLDRICKLYAMEIIYDDKIYHDSEGNLILGSANFERRKINIYNNENHHRERFTLAHEIGHFLLKHDAYMRSEYIVENDLIMKNENRINFAYSRLEIQANKFASSLLLPIDAFAMKLVELSRSLNIRNRGHGPIFVDNQPGNQNVYHRLVEGLALHFDASKAAVEIRLKNMKLVVDKRQKEKDSPIRAISEYLNIFNPPKSK